MAGDAPELPERIADETLRRFVLQTFGRERRTQDSPVTPDVWIRYLRLAEDIGHARISAPRGPFGEVDPSSLPSDAVDLLITPATGAFPGEIAYEIAQTFESEQSWARARVAQSGSRVVALLTFEALVRQVVPLSEWWRGLEGRLTKLPDLLKDLSDPKLQTMKISDILVSYGASTEFFRFAALVGFVRKLMTATEGVHIVKLNQLALQLGPSVSDDEHDPLPGRRRLGEAEVTGAKLNILVDGYREAMDGAAHTVVGGVPGESRRTDVFLVSLNRQAGQTLFDSRLTVKADAAQRVFDISASGIAVAVIDIGIDATHPAFADRRKPPTINAKGDKADPAASRVVATYDFTLLRDLLAMGADVDPPDGPNQKVLKQIGQSERFLKVKEQLHIRRVNARDLDWSIVSPLLQVMHTAEYRAPAADHGTHVAGILAAWLEKPLELTTPLVGVCPDLRLYDLRVFDPDGRGDEFAILCAIEFVGWLNRNRDNPLVHAVNLSLALRHEIDAFACGRTPVCDACNRLVGAGTVVVAAAGNTGFEAAAGRVSTGTGYRSISITDPGNAQAVITVGATHRRDPHAYGVSYFSSRGPTGDGRRKPDLLAPGEKITSTIREGRSARMDGTSMAAPHVTGAAALLMARYPELVGHPQRIKTILQATATDLGREPNFQGAGLLDVLRALQSV